MDLSCTEVVYNRIQEIEPKYVTKIIGYVLLQENGAREMTRLAFAPDSQIHSLINKAKSDLGLSFKEAVYPPVSSPDLPVQFPPFSPTAAVPLPLSVRIPTQYCDPHIVSPELLNSGFPASFPDECLLQNELQFMALQDQLETDYYHTGSALGPRANRRSPSLPEFPVKVCHYYLKGFCKNGSNCRYFHGPPMPENFSQVFSPRDMNDDHVFSPGSLEKLEMELTELLKCQRGFPVSIASLPMIYYDKFGKTLQAEGYLTESQRHGKAGYSLTKLLARLKSIFLIDRPHGQHSVILAEDIPKYMNYNVDRNDHGGIVAGSKQIYLTFPAESIFTEQDVSDYFNKFGPVQDVRIPCQQKRMFGFVTFVFAETVKQILEKGNPHYVCGARVLVKPYREKTKLVDRRYLDKVHHRMYYGPRCLDVEPEFRPMPRISHNSRLLMEEHEHALELERIRFSKMQLAARTLSQMPHFGYSPDEFRIPEGHVEQMRFPFAERFNHLLDNVLNNGSTREEYASLDAVNNDFASEEKPSSINMKYSERESSQELNLPDSPFSPTMASVGISAVTSV